MAKLRVHNLSISLDGYVAGPSQTREEPLGHDGERLHEWMFVDRDPVDHRFWAAGQEGIGAAIMGRNMFGPVRGAWGDEQWRGWWGDDPPFHHDVFVLTHHAHESIPMQGGTTFHFVADGIEAALAQATVAAGGLDVRLGGGAATVQEYLRAGLVDELHLAIVPILLGGGERLFDHLDGCPEGLECAELVSSPRVAHVLLVRR
jgi:dihydrofolate reductase